MLLAHNFGCAGDRPSSPIMLEKRSALWDFVRLDTYGVGDELLHCLEALKAA